MKSYFYDIWDKYAIELITFIALWIASIIIIVGIKTDHPHSMKRIIQILSVENEDDYRKAPRIIALTSDGKIFSKIFLLSSKWEEIEGIPDECTCNLAGDFDDVHLTDCPVNNTHPIDPSRPDNTKEIKCTCPYPVRANVHIPECEVNKYLVKNKYLPSRRCHSECDDGPF